MDESMGARARGGAAVGAGFGALLGAVIGWLLGAQVTDVPTIGPVVGQWVLSSTLVALGAGAAIGALIGALAAMTPPSSDDRAVSQPEESEVLREPATYYETEQVVLAPDVVVVGVVASSDTVEPIVELPQEETAVQDATTAAPLARQGRVRSRKRGPVRALSEGAAASHADSSDFKSEDTNVSDQDKGRDPSSFTGTQDAIDAETGALGTAGTPVTTGYGVSGSTVGTGTRRKRRKQESGEYRGSTPESAPYEVGGRDSGDDGVLEGAERQAPVEEQYSDAGRVEANVPRDQEGRDVYEQSEGYAESLDRDSLARPASTGSQESQGTNIAGTEDPRGLGDNTDGN